MERDGERAMKYVFLVYHEERSRDYMSTNELRSVVRECLEQAEDLRREGRMLAGEALQPVETATTVRVDGGRVSTTDGPFAETKEQLGGFYLVEARDLNEAIRLAARLPQARWGRIEVRPVRDLTQLLAE
jgi:hypothetical protein